LGGGRRGSRLRLGADFGYPPRPGSRASERQAERRSKRKEEGGRNWGGGKKRQQASPRCGFRVPSTPREPERAQREARGGARGRKKEEGIGGGEEEAAGFA
jgi:hypothetical protein